MCSSCGARRRAIEAGTARALAGLDTRDPVPNVPTRRIGIREFRLDICTHPGARCDAPAIIGRLNTESTRRPSAI